jgi:peptide/nickel transport system substrate-binding protein
LGLADGFTLTFETPRGRYPGDDQVALVVAEQLSKVGVRVDLRLAEWGAYLAKLQAGQGEHLFLLAGTNRTFDPHFTIMRLYADTSAFGQHYYGNPQVGELAAAAAVTLDPERPRALYARILAALRQDVPAIWLAQLADLYAFQPRLNWNPRADSLLWMYEARPGT